MDTFLIRIALFALTFFVADKAFILVRDHSPAPQMEADRRLEYVLDNSIRADVLVLGSSRGARSVLAYMLADSLSVPVYNLSYPGSDLTFHAFVLEQVLDHLQPLPHTVLLVLDDPVELQRTPHLEFRSDRLYPLIKYPEIRRQLEARGEKNIFLNRLLVSYQLTRPYLFPREVHFTALDTILPCGSMPLSVQDSKWKPEDRSKMQIKPYSGAELPEKQALFGQLVQHCVSRGIRLVLVCPPNWPPPTPGFAERMQKFAGPPVELMEFDTAQTAYTRSDHFYDQSHLTLNGARLFTQELIRYLKNTPAAR